MAKRGKKQTSARTYPGVYVEEIHSGVRPIIGVTTAVTAFVGYFSKGPVRQAKAVHSSGDFRDVFGDSGADLDLEAGNAVRQFFENGGQDAYVVRVTDEGTKADDLVAALSALDNLDTINILCIPDTVRLQHDEAATVAAAAEVYCETRRAFYILDPPHPPENPVATVEAMRSWIETNASLRHPNAAVYFPRLLLSTGSHVRPAAASGTIAGLYARTDRSAGVWKAPAGLEARLHGVHSLDLVLTDEQSGMLNPLGVNCLRSFPAVSCVSWGARTLMGADELASDWKYISVRRLALFIEDSLHRGTEWVVFEPNGEPLWNKICGAADAFLRRLFLQGALAGTKPTDAYFVRCDETTTTQNDVNLGIVNIDVGFAPLEPAEFVIIKIRQRIVRE